MRASGEQRAASRIFLQFFYTVLLAACCSLLAQAEPSLAQQAELAWQSRDKPGQTEKAIELWTQASQADPKNVEVWINLTKSLGRGVRHAAKSKERRVLAEKARLASEEAVRLAPASAEAYTVYGEALGQWADNHRGIYSLKTVKEAVAALEKAIAINPKHASAHMLLSQFFRQSPATISVGDKKKALKHARLAVLYGPAYAINHLALAEACLDLGQKEEGIAELRLIAALTPPPDAIPETRADQETAQNLLKSLGMATTQSSASCGEAGNACVEKP